MDPNAALPSRPRDARERGVRRVAPPSATAPPLAPQVSPREGRRPRALGASLVALVATGLLHAAPAFAKDYIVTLAKPNDLYLIDADAREIVNTCRLEDGFMSPGIIQVDPAGQIAYILNDRWENVHGIDLDSCERVFSAYQSTDDVRVKTIGSLAVSPDGDEIYTVQNRTRMLADRYEVLEPQLAVFDAAAGLDAKPVRTFPVPRRLTIMATGADGMIYAAGHDIYRIDPATGETEVAIPNASWDRPTYSGPDVLAFWPVGSQNDEFMLLYTAAVFTDESREEIADFVWGYESVDLETGATEIEDFASIEVLMFSAVRNPEAPNELYGVYTQLSKHDLASDTLVKRVDLPHTYYCVNISSDGKTVFVGGTNEDIGFYDSETLERVGEIRLPSGGDMSTSTLQVVQREG